jgi:glycerol-3-phosphate dehydrogenase subunit B
MIEHEEPFDVMVIGTGFAGMSAALFAADRGLSVGLCGSTGGIDFSTGLIDLMGIHPVEKGVSWNDPWAARKAVIEDIPNHPYARVSREHTLMALDEFCDFLAEQHLPYTGYEGRNARILTPLGTVKPTLRVPLSAWEGVRALEEKGSTLIVDFDGLKGFSGRQMVENQGADWPGLRSAVIDFPGCGGELYPEHLAWMMREAPVREQLAKNILALGHDTEYIGFPAILGMADPMRILEHLKTLTGKKIFEIPTLPPSIAGTRLRQAFDRGLPAKKVRTFSQKMVLDASMPAYDYAPFVFNLGTSGPEIRLHARYALLATGRFLGKGLRADRTTVRETVFNLPISQPGPRTEWHKATFFHPQGHPINQCGLETDAAMRPVDGSLRPIHPRLYAAGAILAHHDWMRMKCGAGLALATAFRAVAHIHEQHTAQG